MIEELSTRAASEGTRRRPRWWLITKTENGRIRVPDYVPRGDGGEALPIFSFEEEAEMFLHLSGYADSWSVRESSSGEIVSVLLGPCSGAESVALDPPPKMVAGATLSLVSLRRKRFLERLLGDAG